MKIKRLLGVILTVIMIMSLTPAMAAEAVEAKWGATGGELEYSGTFADAMAALSGDGLETTMTIVLQSDVAEGYSNAIMGGEHIIDLNGHTVNLHTQISIWGGKLTVKDSVGGGQMIYESLGSEFNILCNLSIASDILSTPSMSGFSYPTSLPSTTLKLRLFFGFILEITSIGILYHLPFIRLFDCFKYPSLINL